jgi:hypothetical protein
MFLSGQLDRFVRHLRGQGAGPACVHRAPVGSALERKLGDRHLNEVERPAALACDLDQNSLAVIAYYRSDGSRGTAADCLAELHDQMFGASAHDIEDLVRSKLRQQRVYASVGVDEHDGAAFIGSAADLSARLDLAYGVNVRRSRKQKATRGAIAIYRGLDRKQQIRRPLDLIDERRSVEVADESIGVRQRSLTGRMVVEAGQMAISLLVDGD